MADEQLPLNASTLDVKSVLKELEVPFSPHQVQWRVTKTAKDRKRRQVVPYANPRAYADRLNALFTRSREIAMFVETVRWYAKAADQVSICWFSPFRSRAINPCSKQNGWDTVHQPDHNCATSCIALSPSPATGRRH